MASQPPTSTVDAGLGAGDSSPSSAVRPPTAGSEPEVVEKHEEETPTASHALAQEALDTDTDSTSKGHSETSHSSVEVKDLGWNDDRSKPVPVVGGLSNEELWTLIRRFNKQIFHVRSISEPPLANLDMNIADDEEFSPEKLRAQLERLYVSVAVPLFAFWKHIVRLRSWREWERTASFLSVYVVAWLLDLVVPVLMAFTMALVLVPRARTVCFPPAPPALIDSSTGGVQKPPAGVLASEDSITGAPEKHQGEAVEEEAHSFVNSISTLVISTAAGKNPQADPHDDDVVPDPTKITEDVSNARDKTRGEESSHDHNKTKKPVSDAVWNRARPIMHMIADVVDTWERFGNAINPSKPFPVWQPKLTLAACLLPMLLGSCMVNSYMMIKGIGFGVGFGFFGDPIIQRAIAFANRTYPRWQKFVELRNTILRGIPTNAQLTVTLLRIGEKNDAPLPPPPSADGPPPDKPIDISQEHVDNIAASEEEIHEAAQPSKDKPTESPSKPKKSHRIVNFLRGTTKGGVETALTADKAKAAVGASAARNRLGVVKSSNPYPPTGPIQFPARYKGKKGHAFITTTATTPSLSWTANTDDMKPAWTTTIAEIDELRKVGGLGWKSKIVVGWAMQREVVDGLVVRTDDGREMHLTAVVMRDELFNRLISMGSQMWEAW